MVFLAFAVVIAAGCVRLGFWQMSRLAGRRAMNARITARLDAPPVDAAALLPDERSEMRRVHVAGTLDYDHEIVLANRTSAGSPGVNLLTPLRIHGRDTAILVNRGWVYAPDARTVDRRRWREATEHFEGFALVVPRAPPPTASASPARTDRDPTVLNRVDRSAVAAIVPYPVSPILLVATSVDSSAGAREHAVRLEPPPLDEGSHLSYAIQWFSFAAIALVGAGVVAFRRPSTQFVPPPAPLPRR